MIFISYRISDSLDLVARLADDLIKRFGAENVFRDKNSLQFGQDWPQELQDKARGCRVMLVVIGRGWQEAKFESGRKKGFPRLSDPADWVRREIRAGLDERKVIIPVLVQNALIPEAEWLEECELKELSGKQSAPLRTDPDYLNDLEALVLLLERYVSPIRSSKRFPEARPEPKRWQPAVVYPLQPAPHFAGREALLAELTRWATAGDDPNRVVALVAPGGTGKTALAERVLHSLVGYTAAGVLVWSFYENPQTEAFLRAACEYIAGTAPKETGGLLEALQRSLTGSVPHLFILDGLERVQAEGETGRPWGELEDPLMRRFLRWLAAGKGTCAKALITTRFSLPDLTNWTGAGFRGEVLEDMEETNALVVLRGWGVKGTDGQLRAVLKPLEDDRTRKVHALSVSVLGSYLGKLWGGDTVKAPTFDPQVLAARDPKAAKLTRILTSYAKRLPGGERDLLARLSVFPRGVTVEVIGHLINAGGEAAGQLAGCTQLQVLQILEDLRGLGLVFRYDTAHGQTFTAHPFVREFFEKLLGVADSKQIHEVVCWKLGESLVRRPSEPTDPADLDRLESLIRHTRGAGRTRAAFRLYHDALGGCPHLAWKLGEYSRGLRIASDLLVVGDPTGTTGLSTTELVSLFSDLGAYSSVVGSLQSALDFHTTELRCATQTGQHDIVSDAYQSIAKIYLIQCRLEVASATADKAITHDEGVPGGKALACSAALAGVTRLGLGEVGEARQLFQRARQAEGGELLGFRGCQEGEFLLALGQYSTVARRMKRNHKVCEGRLQASAARSCILLGHVFAPRKQRAATEYLNKARTFCDQSGHLEVALRCYHLAAEIARHERDFSSAVAEAEAGIQLADSCGFGRSSLDIRTVLAQICLAADNPRDAIEPAEWVLRRSQEEDCRYAWGIADSLHLLGVAHARLRGKGSKTKARDYLTRAAEKRKPLEHPGLKETEDELRKLGG
jgi:hypothetical protein